jgi:ElaB/YqjD/DUF883 family membrane-anchored ribosome-binding protein
MKAEAKVVISEIDFEKKLLSGGVVDDLRKSIDDIVAEVRQELKAAHYVFPGDPEAFAVTRDNEVYARECIAIYYTNTCHRGEIEDAINKDVIEFAKASQSQMDAIAIAVSNVVASSYSTLNELSEDRARIDEADGRKILLPWLHYRAVDAARSTLEHLKESAFHVGLMNDIDVVSRGIESFLREVEGKMAEIKVYDANARTSAGKLLSMQFGSGRIEVSYKSKLEAAKGRLAAECISASNIVDEAVSVFVAAVNVDRINIDMAEREAENLYNLHGGEFVDVETIRDCCRKFIQSCVVATNVVNKAKSTFIDAIKERDRIGEDVDEMITRISTSVSMADEKTVMSICRDADKLVARIRMDDDVAAVTNMISDEKMKLDAITKDAQELLDGIKNGLPEWSKVANDMNNELNAETNVATSRRETLCRKIHDLSNMSGDSCERFIKSGKDILKRADELLRSRPEIHCSNGKEVTQARKGVQKYKRAVEDLDKSVSKFCSGFEAAVSNGEISKINYSKCHVDNLLRQFEYGENNFDFSIDFADSREKSIEIAVAKDRGQLFKLNKLAPSIKLEGKVIDETDVELGSGVLYFGNTVEERERMLLSFQTAGDVGYCAFRLKLRLVCGSKELSGSTYSSDWNAQLLHFKLKVDGEDINAVWTKE